MPAPDPVETFITRWENVGPGERSNYQLFLTELCEIIEAPKPEPRAANPADDAYVFERPVGRDSPDGDGDSTVFIDLYKRGCFVLEAKQGADAPASDDLAQPTLSLEGETRARAAAARTGHDLLASLSAPATAANIAAHFTRAHKPCIAEILEALATLGQDTANSDRSEYRSVCRSKFSAPERPQIRTPLQ